MRINRISGNYVFPADCLVVTAMNPCKCGYYPDRSRCNCSERDIRTYLGKISGPIIDRMDMSIEVPRVEMKEEDDKVLAQKQTEQKYLTTAEMKALVERTVAIQRNRQSGTFNGRMDNRQIHQYCRLGRYENDFFRKAYNRFKMSMRGYYKVLKVARTIADMEESKNITVEHLSEALGYRVPFNI